MENTTALLGQLFPDSRLTEQNFSYSICINLKIEGSNLNIVKTQESQEIQFMLEIL